MSPAAGPLVVTAYCAFERVPGVRDCKQLAEAHRKLLVEPLLKSGIAAYIVVTSGMIDVIGLKASLDAAVSFLVKEIGGFHKCLMDGRKLPEAARQGVLFREGADSDCYEVAAASVLAKSLRERIMIRLSERYPQYNFAQHRGYLTKEHKWEILTHGTTPVHRARMLQKLARDHGICLPARPSSKKWFNVVIEWVPWKVLVAQTLILEGEDLTWLM